MKPFKLWIYHKNLRPMIIDDTEFSEYEDEWAKSPAEFFKLSDVGIDKNNILEVQQFGELVEAMTNLENNAANLDKMTRMRLRIWAKDNFNITLRMQNKTIMIAKFRKLLSEQETDIKLCQELQH